MGVDEQLMKVSVIKFLLENIHINKINFHWTRKEKYKVYPPAYKKDLVQAIKNDDILLCTGHTLAPFCGAEYSYTFDRVNLRVGFDLRNSRHQADLVHELTHAHLDMQSFGIHPMVENEAMAYVAEAVFPEAQGKSPLDSTDIRKASQAIAKEILKGGHRWKLSDDDMEPLLEALKVPQYAGRILNSNGFNRSWREKIYRHF
jgi:hypothetical protein